MKILSTKLEKSRLKLTIGLDSVEMEQYLDKTLQKIAKQITIPGFRKGEAPKDLVSRQIPTAELWLEAVESAVNDSYQKAIQDQQLSPLDQPKIELSDKSLKKELEYTAIITVMPEINLPDYRKLAKNIQKGDESISDQEVEEAKIYLRKSRASQSTVDREAKLGDIVDLDYVLNLNQQEFDKAKQMPVEIGAKKFIPGFEDQLIGLKAGQTKDFELTFPADYHNSELAGKLAQFILTVKQVKEIILPEWNEALAQDLTQQTKTLEQIETDLRQGLESERKQEVQTNYTQAVVDSIMQGLEVDLPEVLVNSQKEQIIQEMEQRALYSSQSLDQTLQQLGKTRQELQEEILPQAESRVKLLLILRAVAKEQNFVANPAELEHKVSHFLETYSEQDKKKIDLERLRIMLAGEIVDKMALDYLGNL